MKDKIFFKMLFLYMVDFGCHGNVNFERIICTFLCIVRSDMDYLEFVKIVNSNFC